MEIRVKVREKYYYKIEKNYDNYSMRYFGNIKELEKEGEKVMLVVILRDNIDGFSCILSQ